MDLTTVLQSDFPNINTQNYKHTSPPTAFYNCIAWAAFVDNQWWWPDSGFNYYWPNGVPREESLPAFKAAYNTIGFSECEDGVYEDGYVKIVIYVDVDNKPTHAARLLKEGEWTSKLGTFIDISHESPHVLEGHTYGTPACYMKRSNGFQNP